MPAKGNGSQAVAEGKGTTEAGHDFEHTEVPTAEEVAEQEALGRPGRPLKRRSPFYIGLTGALGVLTAYVLFRLL